MKQSQGSPKPNCVGSFGANNRFKPAGRTVVQFIISSVWCSKEILFLVTTLSNISCSAPSTSGFHRRVMLYRLHTPAHTLFLVHSRTQTQIQPSRLEVYCLPFCKAVWAFELPWPGTYPAPTTYKKGALTYGAAFPPWCTVPLLVYNSALSWTWTSLVSCRWFRWAWTRRW